MPNEDVKFSELPVGTLASDSIFATSENDGNGGLISTGVSAADVGNFTIDNLQYPLKLDTENKKVAGAINELHSSIGAGTYNSASTYNKGDIVIYNGTLYACNDNSVTGAWDATKWDATTLQPKTDNSLATTDKTVVGAINELKSGVDDIGDMVFNLYSTNTQYYTGDTVEYFGDLYKCISTPPSAGYSPSGSPTYWAIQNLSSQVSDIARCLNIRETFVANTSITDALSSIITKYGKNSLMGGFIITGYGFVSFSMSFSDDNQGGGYIVANNKGTGGNTPIMYIFQYTNGTITLGYPM